MAILGDLATLLLNAFVVISGRRETAVESFSESSVNFLLFFALQTASWKNVICWNFSIEITFLIMQQRRIKKCFMVKKNNKLFSLKVEQNLSFYHDLEPYFYEYLINTSGQWFSTRRPTNQNKTHFSDPYIARQLIKYMLRNTALLVLIIRNTGWFFISATHESINISWTRRLNQISWNFL